MSAAFKLRDVEEEPDFPSEAGHRFNTSGISTCRKTVKQCWIDSRGHTQEAVVLVPQR